MHEGSERVRSKRAQLGSEAPGRGSSSYHYRFTDKLNEKSENGRKSGDHRESRAD